MPVCFCVHVQVSVGFTSVTYDALVFDGAVGETVLKSSLCRVVFHQPVALPMQRSDLEGRLTTAYSRIDSSVSSCQVFAQEEVIVASRYTSFPHRFARKILLSFSC